MGWKFFQSAKHRRPKTIYDFVICDGPNCKKHEKDGFYGIDGIDVDLCWECFECHCTDEMKAEIVERRRNCAKAKQ